MKARPIDDVLAGGQVEPAIAAQLKKISQIRQFAVDELRLPDNDSYTRYVDLDRKYVVWNVFAAPELSLELKRWCFLLVGCMTYRGYYDLSQATELAQKLRAEGWDVQVTGVPAYSTLGWFDDPVLSSFIRYPETELTRLIFHELAHQKIYLKGDTMFNESFATAVAEEGVRRWLVKRNDPALFAQHAEQERWRKQIIELLLAKKNALQQVYQSDMTPSEQRERKAEVFQSLRQEYRDLRLQLGGQTGYDRWFAQDHGNAHLATVATYHALVPEFQQMLKQVGGDLEKFYDGVRVASEKRRLE